MAYKFRVVDTEGNFMSLFNATEAQDAGLFPAAVVPDLEQVLITGDNANGQSIQGLQSLSFVDAPQIVSVAIDGLGAATITGAFTNSLAFVGFPELSFDDASFINVNSIMMNATDIFAIFDNGQTQSLAVDWSGTRWTLAADPVQPLDVDYGAGEILNLFDGLKIGDVGGGITGLLSGSATGIAIAAGAGTLLLQSDVNITGTLFLNTNSIRDVVDPVNPQDAATKNYVDTNGLFLLLTGGTMAGGIDMNGNNITMAGGTFTDDIDLANNNLDNAGDVTISATLTVNAGGAIDLCGQVIEITNAGELGFFNTLAVTQQAIAADLTDSTTGTPAAALVDVGAVPTQANINNNFASVDAQLISIRAALAAYGLTS